jgi:hypothetical protein
MRSRFPSGNLYPPSNTTRFIVGFLELGVLALQATNLSMCVGGGSGALARVDLGAVLPHFERLRSITEEPADVSASSGQRLVLGVGLGEHPERALSEFGSVFAGHGSSILI